MTNWEREREIAKQFQKGDLVLVDLGGKPSVPFLAQVKDIAYYGDADATGSHFDGAVAVLLNHRFGPGLGGPLPGVLPSEIIDRWKKVEIK